MNKDKFIIQDEEYKFPYHHLVEFRDFSNAKILNWGFEYYAYNKFILDFLNSYKYHTLLDVGCGEGKFIKELLSGGIRNESKNVVGIDMSERAILFAKGFNYDNQAVFNQNDIKDVRDTYDVITLIQVLEHIPDEEIHALARNIYDRLNDGGIFIVAVPTKNFSLLAKHYRHYDLEMLQDTFKALKLEEKHFFVKNGLLYSLFIRFSGKLSVFGSIRKVTFGLAKKFMFCAEANNGRHIVCVFRKEKKYDGKE